MGVLLPTIELKNGAELRNGPPVTFNSKANYCKQCLTQIS
uniref:Uncharacterized protein n=1 Tax=Rhizophora mucronata TaxID=61149 RepID=A0A2P2Q1U0_RHIMU